jgi:hypothetical protein
MNVSIALHACGSRFPIQHVHFNAQLIAWNDRAPELGSFDAGENHQHRIAIRHLG